ncbi:unnamed protein product [Closterium sp. Naga37s-1]|nr:unnamed protein product [Closterium sp. Naga37s-1]
MDGASGMEGVSTSGLTHPRQRQQQLVGSNNRQRWGGGSDRSREGSSSCRGGVGINNPQRWGGEQQPTEVGWGAITRRGGVGSNNPQRWGGEQQTAEVGWGATTRRGGVGSNSPQRWGGEQQPTEEESETVLMIRELLETRFQPAPSQSPRVFSPLRQPLPNAASPSGGEELLETRIRPAVQEDGGDIDFVDFDE